MHHLSNITFLTLLLISVPSGAVLKPNQLLGESVVQHQVAGGRPELCVIPKHYSIGKYSKKDLAREQTLCSYNIDVNIAGCPKLNSTNPGVNFMLPPPGMSVNQYLSQNCEATNDEKEAKYKLSTSCSYTPALLAYYHVSRWLGRVGKVPVAVVRTMNLERHKAIAAEGLSQLKDPSALIYRTWASLNAALKAGPAGPRPDLLFVEGFDQSYGALQKNPKGEEFYREFFSSGTDRAAAFRDSNPIYRALISSRLTAGRELSVSNLQTLIALKDASDMILLDTILGQQDRFGNIHFEENYFYPTVSKTNEYKLKSESDLAEIPEIDRAKALKIKEMVLKDNDCGVAKSNRVKEAKLLDRVAHMDPDTYNNLMLMVKAAAQADFKEHFIRGMLFTEDDFRKVTGNLLEAAKMLQNLCTSGRLKLDLDYNLHFSGQPLPTTYNCAP